MTASRLHRIPISEFPYPPGTVVGDQCLHFVVTDREGYAFLVCCQAHHQAGTAFGYHPLRSNGLIFFGTMHGRYDGPFPDSCNWDQGT
jgi:hypothetical protein